MSLFAANNMRMLEKSMTFLWAKQTAHLDNIANAETPGYKVKTVRFEEAFQRKLLRAARDPDVSRADFREVLKDSNWTVNEDEEITRMDENGVNATEQMLESVRTAYQLQATYRVVSSELSTLKTAITGQ